MSPLKKTVAKGPAKKVSKPATGKKAAKKSAAPVKQAPPRMREEDRFRIILEETALGYGESDLAGNITFVNDAGAGNIGYAPMEIVGKNFRDFTSVTHAKKLREIFKNIHKTGMPVKGVEVEFLHKDGSLRIVEVSANLLLDDKGRPAGFRGVSNDITQRKKAEAELKLSEARLQSLAEIMQFTAKDMPEWLDKALEHAIGLTGSKIGYIYYYSEASEQFTLNTWSRDVMKECSVTEPQTIYNLEKTGVWGEAVRQRKPIILNDYPAPNPLKKGYPEGHVHLRRFLTIPVFSGDKIIAVVGVANKESDYNDSDIRQLTLLMDTVWTIFERRRMELELLKKEEGYRTILEVLEEGYCEMDLLGQITFVNQAGARIIGYTPEEMIGNNFRRYVSQSTLKELLGLFKNIYKTRKPIKRIEMEYINKDGVKRYLEVSGALILDDAGNPAGFRGLAHDVTRSKWTEDALLQSEAKYLSIIESIGHAYFETDLRGYLTFFNDTICRDLGYTRTELMSMTHRELQDAENAKKTFDTFNRVYQTGEPHLDYTYEAIRKDGSRTIFETSVSLMRDAQGAPIGFRGLSRDITERRRIEKALKASEARARSIIATIPDPYFEIDLNRNITFVNQAFQSLVGYHLHELTQMDQKAYLGEKAAEEMVNLCNAVQITDMTMKNIDIEITDRNGDKRIVNLSISLIHDPQGEATGYHGIMRDITDKKEAEALILESSAKLMQYSESLEQSVQERTAELEKAKIAAEAASRAKSDFLANISHEFQTPLNAIVGFTKVLNDRLFGDLNAKQEEFVKYISEAGESLSKLLNEIIDVSSVASGRTHLAFAPVSIPKTLGQAASLLKRLISEKEQTLTVNVALDADVSIEADEEKVHNIFFQLISNAVKYTPVGGKITIDAQKAQGAAGDEGVSVTISDSGPGIKPEDIPKLFQNFGRLESAYTRQSGGVGVGLSLTRHLVELLGGEIGVTSEYGSGSTFSVFLPLVQKRQGLPGS